MTVTRQRIVFLVLAVLMAAGSVFLGTAASADVIADETDDAKAKEAKAGGAIA